MILWVLELAAAAAIIGPYTRHHWFLALLLLVGLIAGGYMHRHDRHSFYGICGIGAGIDLMLLAWLLAYRDLADRDAVAVVGGSGAVIMLASVVAIMSGQNGAVKGKGSG